MKAKYDLNRMLEEIKEDEGSKVEKERIVSQNEIGDILKAAPKKKKKVQPNE